MRFKFCANLSNFIIESTYRKERGAVSLPFAISGKYYLIICEMRIGGKWQLAAVN